MSQEEWVQPMFQKGRTQPMSQEDELITGAGVGHNSRLTPSAITALRNSIAGIERMEEEKAEIAAQIKEAFAHAKSIGFDTKVMRKVIALRKQDKADREEFETLVDLYMKHVESV